MEIVVVAGPTASGKTNFAINLAKQINGEIINADSRQIYKYANIGTNKGNIVKKEDSNLYLIENIPIHLVNIKNPGEKYSCFEFQQESFLIFQNINKRNKKAIFVGGTGLYISSIVDDNFIYTKEYLVDWNKRKELEKLTLEEIQKKVLSIDKNIFLKLTESDKKNKRRLIRLIEKNINQKSELIQNPFNKVKKIIYYPNISLYEITKNIEDRINTILDQWIDETQKLLKEGFSIEAIETCGIGYKEIINYIQNREIEKKENLKKILIQKHKQYAKKQEIWFKKYIKEKFEITSF